MIAEWSINVKYQIIHEECISIREADILINYILIDWGHHYKAPL